MFLLCKINFSFKLKDTLKAFDDFKTKQQKCMKYCFLTCESMNIPKVCSIHYTSRKNTNVIKNFVRTN